MTCLEETLARFPKNIQKTWSPGFVFMYDGRKFQHFPARQWSDEQIKDYFIQRFKSECVIFNHLAHSLKELQVENHPELTVIIPC